MKLPSVTSKQTEILTLLYRFRFLNRIQIQTMLGHSYPSRVKAWLANLTKKKVLSRTYSRKFGENTKPATYYLATKSRYLLMGREDVVPALLRRVYKEKQRSAAFREHCQFIADIYLLLESVSKENKGTLDFFTKTELEEYRYFPDPLPDAYIALKKGGEYFLEVIGEQIPRFVLRGRIEYLVEYFDSQEWQKNTGEPFPMILMVCPSPLTKSFLSRFIGKTLESEGSDISFYLTTSDQIKTRGMQLDIWQEWQMLISKNVRLKIVRPELVEGCPRVVDDVRTLVINSNEYISIPKLEQIPTNYI